MSDNMEDVILINQMKLAGKVAATEQDVIGLGTQLNSATKNGTAKPVVPLLTATYEANKATYDAQDVIWALHDDPIV